MVRVTCVPNAFNATTIFPYLRRERDAVQQSEVGESKRAFAVFPTHTT